MNELLGIVGILMFMGLPVIAVILFTILLIVGYGFIQALVYTVLTSLGLFFISLVLLKINDYFNKKEEL